MIEEIRAGKAPPMLAMRHDPPWQIAILEVLQNGSLATRPALRPSSQASELPLEEFLALFESGAPCGIKLTTGNSD
jgi:hypothetical protein